MLKKVKDVQFITACAPPGGGRNQVTPRLFRHFNMLWVPELKDTSMETIFTSILKGYLAVKDQNIAMYASQIIKSAVIIYNRAKDDFLPTPTKSHYTFNLRDMSKVVQGMTMCPVDALGGDKDNLTTLYLHESYRVFRDRLTDENDKTRFNELSEQMLSNNNIMPVDGDEQIANVMFGKFDPTAGKGYVRMSNLDSIMRKLNEVLSSYNMNNTEMNLVFFEDCIKHLASISRILQ